MTRRERAGERFLSRRDFRKGRDVEGLCVGALGGWNFGRETRGKRMERSGKRQISDPRSVKTLKGSR